MATVYKLPTGDWRAQVRSDGRRISKVFPLRADAKEWAAKQEYVKRTTAVCGTVEDAFKRYAAEVSPKHNGERWERVRLNMLARFPIAKVRLSALGPPHVAAWRDQRLKEVSRGTVLRELNLLSQVFGTCVREWLWLSENPVKAITRPPKPPARDRRISQDEIDLIVNNCANHELRVLFELAIETAMRLSEMLSIAPERVNGPVVLLPKTKNGDSRKIPLSPKAQELLREVGYRFTIRPGTASKAFHDLTRRLGIEDLRFHDTRHEACTRLAQKKISVLDLARITGHRDVNSLMIYYNRSAEDLAELLK